VYDTPGVFSINTHEARMKRMAQSIRTAARLIEETIVGQKERYQCVMQTLTVAPGYRWKEKDISDYIDCIRKWADRRGIKARYAWVCEVQRRGAIHYHVMIWLPKRMQLPKADKQGWWKHGSTNTKRVYAPISYAIKYTTKGSSEAKRYPKGCRIAGSGGLTAPQRLERAWWACPLWVRKQSSVEDLPRRANGGGFCLRASGALLESPWRVVSYGEGSVVICLKVPISVIPRERDVPGRVLRQKKDEGELVACRKILLKRESEHDASSV
jgi:hypothetical protein